MAEISGIEWKVEGEAGKPGVVRYCSSASSGMWVKEKLLMINHAERCLSYEIVDNNMGFKSYAATFQVLDDSKIEWSFVADPVEGMGLQDLESYADECLQFMAKTIQASCVSC
ncbi:Polyketide cyclase/dehydrase and lipid transport superfamily protein [Euphorbia peplus]|nr:Polyketide cyclase/dehydrase and lipid transport superfamily protein [Euphorbia peplus]